MSEQRVTSFQRLNGNLRTNKMDGVQDRIIISQIPPAATYSDLLTLFKTATQIKQLRYYRLQGKAVLTLHDATSSEFLLEKTWAVCGVRLHMEMSVITSKRSCSDGYKRTSVLPRPSVLSDYQAFKTQRDAFWSDIPHEKSEMSRRKKRIKHRYRCTKKEISEKTKTKARKTLVQRKLKIQKKKVYSPIASEWESMDIFQRLTETEATCSPDSNSFHVHVKAESFFTLRFTEVPTLKTLKNAIRERTMVPEGLQLLTHMGKLLRPSNMKQVCSEDTIHLLIRGIGGMERASNSGPRILITPESSEETEQKWMINTVGVPEKFVRQNSNLDQLDGKTLHQYSSTNELKIEAGLPLGPAKKIIYVRDNPSLVRICDMDIKYLEQIAPEDIEQFVIESLNKDKDPSLIARRIREEQMDGFVMMLYDKHTDFANDISIKTIVARRLLENVQGKIKEKIRRIVSATPQDDSSFDSFLQCLSFQKVEPAATDIKQCHLVAIHSSLPFGSGNALAQAFLFLALCTNEEFQAKDFKRRVWDYIHGNMDEFISSLPDDDPFKCSIKRGKSDKRCSYVYGGNTNVSLCKVGEKIVAITKLDAKSREWYHNYVLLVSENVAEAIQSKSYFSIDKSLKQCYQIHRTKFWIYNKTCKKTPSANKTDNSPSTLKDISFQTPREFKTKGENILYFRDYVMEKPESGDGMITPSVEFKYFASSFNTAYENSPMKKFLMETMRFACGCLNRRRNGTIYFGIADDKPVDGTCYRHGQVVGFPTREMDETSKSNYTDKLDEAKCKWFDSPEANDAARECIKSPVFVRVVNTSNEFPHFVMEVDIEPSHIFCNGIKFKLCLPNKISGIKSEGVIYVRDGAATKQETDERYFVSQLAKYDGKRKLEEESLTRVHSVDPSHKYLSEKLSRIMCGGKGEFDTSTWLILLSSKATQVTREGIYSTLKFISDMRWLAVFDFDDEGYTNGLCKHYFGSSSTTITSGDYFRDIDNINTLRDTLHLPEQNVYIFSNGRKDQSTSHLQRPDWKKQYSPGVKSAVHFLQNRSVIPPGRALVVCLLFSSDFDGFLDTFGEIGTYFGFGQVAMICSDREVFRLFENSAVSQGIVEPGELDSCSVVGMTWEQVNDSVKRLLGVEEPSRTYLSTSSGAFIEVDPKVEESLNCLSILSASECEHKHLEPGPERTAFIHSKELKFYQGNRVEWWNFFFPGHVLERSCFHKLKQKVNDALSGNSPYKNRINNIYLIHEPGSGGSTLARHILWEFHKSHRCVIIKKMTEKTASDIYKILMYKENYNAKPLLVLLDSVPQHDIDIEDLCRLLRVKHDHPATTMCVFLICKRETHDSRNTPLHQNDVTGCEMLFQKLTPSEIKWCKNKFHELEITGKELGLGAPKVEYFISFMIFREGFSKEFLRSTVESLIINIDPTSNAFKLLTYAALLIAFVTPPRGGAATAIPVECCSELMGLNSFIKTDEQNSAWWEYNLDGPFKILLIVEPKELGGFGKQIRMAHPNLAKVVINCVKRQSENDPNTKCSLLAETVIQFLESKLLHNSSHAQKEISALSTEMLIRRRKDEFDEEDSTFSPLIESINSEDSHSYESAAAVMIKGFHILKNGFIAQQLARLYLHFNKLNEAKEWALVADECRPNTPSILHTLGRVYKKTFLTSKAWDSKTRLPPCSEDVKESLDEAFEALQIFMKANAGEEMNLASCCDILATVNSVARFLHEKVHMGEKNSTHRYLTEEDFEPESVQGQWGKYRKSMKSLYNYAMDSVRQIDDHVFHNRRTYSVGYNVQRKVDRTSRIVKYKVPDLFEDFSNYFGEFDDSRDPPTYLTSHPMIDSWHRRRVLTLGGSRLTDILKILIQQKKKQYSVEHAIDRLTKIEKHLHDIWDKSGDDFLAIISVHIVLAQFTASKYTYKIEQLLNFCREIISSEKKGRVLKEAYMYAIILMWPRPNMRGVKYDHNLMTSAVKFLNDNKKTKVQPKVQQKYKNDKDLFQTETFRYQSMNLFYAGQGKGLASVCCHCDVFPRTSDTHDVDFAEKWRGRTVTEKLQFYNGYTKLKPKSNIVTIVFDPKEYGISQQIELRNFRCEMPERTEKPVSFYVGFSLSGPTVCHMKSRHVGENLYCEPRLSSSSSSSDNDNDYTQFSKEELENLLSNIELLKKNTEENITEKEKKLLENEGNIKEALLKYDEDFE